MPELREDQADLHRYVTDEWKRWQQGKCGTYAYALQSARPHLRAVAAGTTESDDIDDGWRTEHFYVTDGAWAYDSAGRHPLPYLGTEGQWNYTEDACLAWFGIPDEEAGPEGADTHVEAALAHAERNGILALIDRGPAGKLTR
jgi:hypothetical protein